MPVGSCLGPGVWNFSMVDTCNVDFYLPCWALGEAFQCKTTPLVLGNSAEFFHRSFFLCFLALFWSGRGCLHHCSVFPSRCQSHCILALLPRRFPSFYLPIFQYNCYFTCFDFWNITWWLGSLLGLASSSLGLSRGCVASAEIFFSWVLSTPQASPCGVSFSYRYLESQRLRVQRIEANPLACDLRGLWFLLAISLRSPQCLCLLIFFLFTSHFFPGLPAWWVMACYQMKHEGWGFQNLWPCSINNYALAGPVLALNLPGISNLQVLRLQHRPLVFCQMRDG